MAMLDKILEKVLTDNAQLLSKKSNEEFQIMMNDILNNRDFSKLVFKDLKKDAKKMLNEHRYDEQDFTNRIINQWEKALDTLETIVVISLESGEIFSEDFCQQAQEENNLLFYASRIIHARAIQIAKEGLLLLKNGYAEGAYSRWRSLYELSVVTMFLHQYNKDDLVEKYLLHGAVEEYQEELLYRKTPRVRQQYTNKAFNDMKNSYFKLKNKYGNNFIKANGWASKILNKDKVYFSDIEDAISYTHLRPFYKTACTTIHSGHNGNVNKIGNFNNKGVLPCGPSNYGLSAPCQNIGISLVNLTITFLNTYPSADSIAASQILDMFIKELLSICNEIQVKIENECLENEKLIPKKPIN